jgi:hypothetical protein
MEELQGLTVEFTQFPVFNADTYLIIRPIPILVGERRPAQGGERVTSGASEKKVRKLHDFLDICWAEC